MREKRLKQVVEALIFASDHALPVTEITQVLENVSEEQVRDAVAQLNQEYTDTERTLMIREQNGGLRFITHPDFHQYISKLLKGRRKTRLSRAALETLAIVAYKQPVSRPIIEAIRGVNIDGVIATLLERRLVTLAGRGDGPGQPLLYKTTGDFLEYFGLIDLAALPNLREIKEIFTESEAFKNILPEQLAEPPGTANADGDDGDVVADDTSDETPDDAEAPDTVAERDGAADPMDEETPAGTETDDPEPEPVAVIDVATDTMEHETPAGTETDDPEPEPVAVIDGVTDTMEHETPEGTETDDPETESTSADRPAE